jgi:hypothetical protein
VVVRDTAIHVLLADRALLIVQLAPLQARLDEINLEILRREIADMSIEERHRRQLHPEFEYRTTTTGEPLGDGWAPNLCVECHVYSDGVIVHEQWRSWDRDEYTETHYWMRLRTT